MAFGKTKIAVDIDLEALNETVIHLERVIDKLHKETDKALEAVKELNKAVERAANERRRFGSHI